MTVLDRDNPGTVMDLQSLTVKKGSGTFAFLHGMPGPGYFHVSMSAERAGGHVQVAGAYFGTGDNLLPEQAAAGPAP